MCCCLEVLNIVNLCDSYLGLVEIVSILLSYEPITVCFLPTCFKVYNLGLKCKASGCVSYMAVLFER